MRARPLRKPYIENFGNVSRYSEDIGLPYKCLGSHNDKPGKML